MEQTSEPKEAANKSSSVTSDGDKVDYVHGTRLVALTASLMLGMFLTALDNVCISDHRSVSTENDDSISRLSSALRSPRISDEFHDLNKVSWYGAAYFMTFGGGK
jgi:hypothetical protein